MTAKQQDLFELKPDKRERVKLAGRMMRILSATKGWVTRREFHEINGFSRDGRDCRAGREASHERIICGQQGYKRLTFATDEELGEALGRARKDLLAAERRYLSLNKRVHAELARRERDEPKTAIHTE